MKKFIKNMSIFFLVFIVLAYLAAAGFLYTNQTRLMYFPSPETPQEKSWKIIYSDTSPGGVPVVLGYEFNSVNQVSNNNSVGIFNDSQKSLTSTHMKSKKPPLKNNFAQILPKKEEWIQTVLLFHGNAGSAAHRAYYQSIFPANTKIIVAEYPGFGANFKESIGKEVFMQRARELTQKVLKSSSNVIVAGESLGTGIAAQIAQENKISKMVLFTPYSSISEVASYRYPWVPVSYLLKDNYDTLDSVSKYAGNTLVVLSEQDKTIPVQFGKKVFDTIKSAKTQILVKNAGHSTWWAHMSAEQKLKFLDFLRS